MAAKQADHQQHQQGEWQVDQAGQGQGREKIAQGLKLMNVLRKTADPRRPVAHGHADDALEQGGGDDQVGLLAGQVQAQAAHGFEDQVEHIGAGDAHRQHPQGRRGLVGHHTVVDVHHEQRRRQTDQVDQQAGRHRIDIQPARTLEGVAKPGTGPRNEIAMADIEAMPRLGEEHLAAVVLGQQLGLDLHLATFALAEQQARIAVSGPAQQDGTAPLAQLEQGRHGNRRNLRQGAAQPASLQPGTGGGTGQQLGIQALGRQGQAGRQHGPTGGPLMQDTERQQAVQQWIVIAPTRVALGQR